jgi:hypothetical protein
VTCACEAFGGDKLVTGSDDRVLQDWEEYRETFAYIGQVGLPDDVRIASFIITLRNCSASPINLARGGGEVARRWYRG